MDRLQKSKYLLPGIFTIANMLFGFYSIIAALNHKWLVAGAVLTIAVVMDGLDGRVARYTNTTSEFGINFDSIVDAISFGVAPAVVIYLKWLSQVRQFANFAWVLSFLFVAAGTIRLARFNVQAGTREKKASAFFKGLPIPAASSLLATSLWVFSKYEQSYPYLVKIIPKCIPAFMIILTYLMISNIKYFSFKRVLFFKTNPILTTVIGFVLLGLLVLKPAIVFFFLTLGYVLSGIILKVYMIKKIDSIKHAKGDVISDEKRQ